MQWAHFEDRWRLAIDDNLWIDITEIDGDGSWCNCRARNSRDILCWLFGRCSLEAPKVDMRPERVGKATVKPFHHSVDATIVCRS